VHYGINHIRSFEPERPVLVGSSRLNWNAMNDKALKAAVDLFLKNVSFSARREIETVIRNAVASGKIEGHETVTAAVALSAEKVGLDVTIYSKIEL
jgi:hypothetical protein